MSFLDNIGQSFGNMTNDPRQMGLLMAAAQMMAQSGPSNRPVGLGEIMGGGLQTYLGTKNAMGQQQAEAEEREQQKQYRGVQMQGMQMEQDKVRQALARAQEVQRALKNRPNARQQAIGQMNGPTMANAQALNQMQPQGDESLYQQLMSEAMYLRSEGFDNEAMAKAKEALQFKPKYSTTPQKLTGPDGKLGVYQLSEDGSPAVNVGLGAAPEMVEMNLGGTTQWADKNVLTNGQTFRRTQSPDSVASAAATRSIAEATRYAADQNRNQATEMKLADDYTAQSKGFKEVSDAYRTINASLDKATTSPAATLASATKFMKLLDPGSVVRESELGMALAATGVFDRAANYYETLKRGRVLTPNQVQDFKSITQQIYAAAQKGQQDIDGSYRHRAQTYGLRPDVIIQDLGQSGNVVDFGSLK